jgi:hypothetical protein
VWSKRSAQVPATALRSALGEYWKIVKQIRDNWKTETTALQEAEEKKDKPRIEYHQARATDQRNMMETVFSVTLQYGHPDIVKKYVPPSSSNPLPISLHRLYFDTCYSLFNQWAYEVNLFHNKYPK